MTICITGATGFVGQAVTAAAVHAGHTVRAIVRQGSAHRLMESPHCIPIEGNACVVDDLARGLAGCEAAIHLVGIKREQIRRTGLTYADVDVGSARAMATAMHRVGMRRLLLLSAGAIGNSVYVRCKAEAERVVMTADLDWTIFRPSFILGPGQRWPILLEPLLALASILPGRLGEISRLARSVSREELAGAMIRALTDPESIRAIVDVPAIRRMRRPHPPGN